MSRFPMILLITLSFNVSAYAQDGNSASTTSTTEVFEYKIVPKAASQKNEKIDQGDRAAEPSSTWNPSLAEPLAVYSTPFLPAQSLIHSSEKIYAFSVVSSNFGLLHREKLSEDELKRSLEEYHPVMLDRVVVDDLLGSKPFFVGGQVSNERIFAVEGDRVEMFEFDSTNYKILSQQSMTWDLILPPLDRGQEEPKWAIQKFRNNFSIAFKKTNLPLLWGVTSWADVKQKPSINLRYLASTQIPGHPLIEISCSEKSYSACSLFRSCKVSGPVPEAKNIRGMGSYQKWLVLADSQNSKVYFYGGTECSQIKNVGSADFPAKFGRMSHLSVADDGSLWVLTKGRDDIYNANLWQFDLDWPVSGR